MGLDDWELLDCHEDGEKKLSSAKLGVDQKMAIDLNDTDQSISVSDQQHAITGRAACEVQADEDIVSQVCTGAESDVHEEVEGKEEGVNSRRMNMAMEKRQKWGRAAICSFVIAMAATICTVLLGSHSHQQGEPTKQQKNQICPSE